MLAQFRALAKSPVATVLFAVLALSFVVWQANGSLRSAGRMTRDDVIKAGGRTVGPAKFKRVFEGYLQQLAQQNNGQAPTVQEAVDNGVDRRVAESIGDDLAFAEVMSHAGVRASDRQVLAEIRKASAFFDPITGAFDKKQYAARLAQAGLTREEFEQSLADEITQTQFVSGMVGGLRAPRVYAAVLTGYLREGRSFGYFAVTPQAVGGVKTPTDADLNGFLKENAARLMRPAMRTLSVVRFSTAETAQTTAADPALVQKRFDFEKDSLSQPEKRTLVQITAKDAPSAAALAARLKAGADPAQAAKAAGAQLLPYAAVPKTAVADKRVADVAFGLPAGEVSGAIQGDLGWAVVKVLAVVPGHLATLEEARPRIEALVKKDAAQAKVYAQVQKYEDARAGGAGVLDAAKTVGVAPIVLGPITEQGANAMGQPLSIPPKLLEAAFKLPPGGESDSIDLGQGEWLAVKVDKVQPPSPPTLEEIRPQLTRFFVMQDLAKRLQAKAGALAEAVRKGQSLPAAAASVGATVGNGVGVLRDGGGQTFSKDLLGRVFAAKKGEVVVGEDVRLGFVVARVDQVSPPSPAEAAPTLEAQRQDTTRALFNDLGTATRAAAHARVKPVIDEKRVRQALGVSDTSAPPATGAAATGSRKAS